MDVYQHLDLYCERTGEGLAAEPLNAISNAGFLIACILLAKIARKQGTKDRAHWLLIALTGLVGLGSLSFHTFANVLTAWFDVAFIALFIIFYIYYALRRQLGLSRLWSAGAVAFFLLATAKLHGVIPEPSAKPLAIYGSSLLVLFMLAVQLRLRGNGLWRSFTVAGILFASSLTLRMMDLRICESLPSGTHYFWHLLNAAVMYTLVRPLLVPKSQTAS